MTEPLYMTRQDSLEEGVRLLKVSRRTVERHLGTGTLPGQKIGHAVSR